MIDNRETSVLFWLAAFALWVGSNASARKAAGNVVRAALAWKLVAGVFLFGGYVSLVVGLLNTLGLWNLSHLKSTILWFFSAGLLMVSGVVSSQDDERYFRKAVLDGFKLSIILEFIVNLYVLSLPAELILVPIATILGCMLVIAESKEELKAARAPLNTLLALLGFSLLFYSLYQIHAHFEEFANVAMLSEFLLPIVLTILFIPCLYLLATYVSYENLFLRLRFFMKDDSLRRFTKIQLLLRLNFKFRAVSRWEKRFIQERPDTREAVLASIRAML